MSGYRRKPIAVPAQSVDGWITKRKHKHEFAPVNHISGDLLEQKRSPTKITPTKTHHDPEDIKPTSSKVTNPYKTQVSTKTKEVTYKINKSEDKGLPFSLIKQQNKLYFSYNPRGYPIDPLPNDYCKHCRCPINYRAEVVFGKTSMNFVETLAYTSGLHCTEERSDMKKIFDRAYTKLVFAKIRFNGFDLNVEESETSWRALKIPRCVKKESMKKFLCKIEANNYPDFGSDWDEEKEEEELKEKGEFTTRHPIMKRTAVEQSQDITVMFKKMKEEINRKATAM